MRAPAAAGRCDGHAIRPIAFLYDEIANLVHLREKNEEKTEESYKIESFSPDSVMVVRLFLSIFATEKPKKHIHYEENNSHHCHDGAGGQV